MRDWALTSESPLSLRIAADARMTSPSYVDDQIWELSLEGGEPPALALETTYGLRARGMRLFPGFRAGGQRVTDPTQFAAPPVVRRFLPNYLCVEFSPWSGIDVQAEYWVPASDLMGGRFRLRNSSLETRQVEVSLYALLRPGEDPQVMDEVTVDGVTVLSGQTGPVAPVVFLGGGSAPEREPYPALAVAAELEPGGAKSILWSHAGKSDRRASFEAARELAARPWDGEIARLELENASLVEIETGDPEWDITLALAQKVSLGCYVGPTKHLPFPSFVLTRLPDRGYSERGDGRDYSPQWDGQTALHAYFNLSQILPAAPELAKGVIRNFLAARGPAGSVDWKPGLGGQRNGAISVPLLAACTWRIYRHTEDRGFIEEVFPLLVDFYEAWFTKEHDRDQDGHPEWDHTLQAGFDDWPTFVRWRAWGQGLDITKAETPDLACYLIREGEALMAMASLIGRVDLIEGLRGRVARLRESIEAGWEEETACYHHLDRNLHRSVPGEALGSGRGQFILEVDRVFDPAVRVLARSSGEEGLSHAIQVFIHGKGRTRRHRVERLTERQFQWFWNLGTATTERAYTEIERVEVRGVSDDFQTEVLIADYTRQDQTCLLPLWAGLPDPERAGALVRKTLLDPDRFWRRFGVPNCSARDAAYAPDNREGSGGVWMLWNTMIGEGLLDHGYREEAVTLLSRLVKTTVMALRKDKSFREAYNADQPEGIGERDHLGGVAPVSLFLDLLGVRLVSPSKAWLCPDNPFPWPVRLRWRGLEIHWEDGAAGVTFPNGEQVEVHGEGLQVIEQGPRGE